MVRELTRRSVLLAGAGAALAACSDSAPERPRVAAPADGTLVMIIRHAEKPTGDGAPYGITPDGTKDDESLIVPGWQRAGALVELFDPRDGKFPTGLARPSYVMAADPSHGSKRPAQTVTPVAERLKVTLDTRFRKGQEAQLADALVHQNGVTLVAWEHENIPPIVKGLGHVSPTPPSSWPGKRFDLVWCFIRVPGGWRFEQVPQLLLAGDKNKPA